MTDNDKRIFSFTDCDAWGVPSSQFEIFDVEKDNVKQTDSFGGTAFRTISAEVLGKIKAEIRNHPGVFEYEELEFPLILDGYIWEFDFSLDGKSNHFSGFNLDAFYSEEPEKCSGAFPAKAIDVLLLQDEIKWLIWGHEKYRWKKEVIQKLYGEEY